MNPVEFKEQTHLMGKEQPEFNVLPVCIINPNPLENYAGEIISVWQLTDEELELIKTTKQVYLRIQGGQQPPVLLEVKNPFIYPEEVREEESQTPIINLKQNN